MSLPTTAGAIRDRIVAVIAGLVPTFGPRDRFRAYRNEGDADFTAWAQANPASALRRFQVRDSGVDEPPEVTNTDAELRTVAFEILVAYPMTNRAGAGSGTSRDQLIADDARAIEAAIGMAGRGNFAPPHPDACWRAEDWLVEFVDANGVEFMRITVGYQYVLSLTLLGL